MLKRFLVVPVLLAILLVAAVARNANAALYLIGTADYAGGTYNLIYDPDSPLGPITWLDYSQSGYPRGEALIGWGASVSVTLHLNPGVITDWDGSGWRLPMAGDNPQIGYNQTTSEFGHLFYTELQNPAGPNWTNRGDFQHLSGYPPYWTCTRSSRWESYWSFSYQGYQTDEFAAAGYYSYNAGSGMAVHPGAIQLPTTPTCSPSWGRLKSLYR
jgi:hypothetical protein